MSNDGVAKLSPFTHETRRLSCDHEDGVDAVRHRVDAVAATASVKLIFHAESLTADLEHDLTLEGLSMGIEVVLERLQEARVRVLEG